VEKVQTIAVNWLPGAAAEHLVAPWPAPDRNDDSPKARRAFRILIKRKFMANLMRIKQYKSVGATLFMASYPEYLRARDRIAGQYSVELGQDFANWKRVVDGYVQSLQALPHSTHWSGVHWVGSTAVEGLISKPIIDLMITTTCGVEETLLAVASEMDNEAWQQQHGAGLLFPIGFFGNQGGVDWGFLQMPAYHAMERGLIECNLHIFPSGEQVAEEKLLMRDFLNSPEGQDLKLRYSNVKETLEAKIKRGEMETAEYNKGKGEVIAEIISASKAWKACPVIQPRASERNPVYAMITSHV